MSIKSEVDRIKTNVNLAYTAVAEKGGTLPEVRSINNLADSIKTISSGGGTGKVYGVKRISSYATSLARTDDAEKFLDPVFSLDGSKGFSQFDNIYPWSEMKVVYYGSAGGMFVSIPKYYVKISNDPFSIQITDKPKEGFSVSPAHQDRGYGEKDVVYVGRYLYGGTSSAISNSGYTSSQKVTIENARRYLKVSNCYLMDYYMYLTLLYLFMVETARLNLASSIIVSFPKKETIYNKIKTVTTTGTTDSMPYCTGVTNGVFQYRNIEDYIGGPNEYIDGVILKGNYSKKRMEFNICRHPKNYSNEITSNYISFPMSFDASGYSFVEAIGEPNIVYPSKIKSTPMYDLDNIKVDFKTEILDSDFLYSFIYNKTNNYAPTYYDFSKRIDTSNEGMSGRAMYIS